MRDIPIIFSAPMVRALLDGRKTQTRRILKPQPKPFPVDDTGTMCDVGLIHIEGDPLPRVWLGKDGAGVLTTQEVRYAVGDRLWVRENWRLWDGPYCAPGSGEPLDPDVIKGSLSGFDAEWLRNRPVDYAATNSDDGPWRPSIHMPRWASRLTLLVEGVKVERLQDISRNDAQAEGATSRPNCNGFMSKYDGWSMEWDQVGKPSHFAPDGRLTERCISLGSADMAFANYWIKLHGELSWDENPWVVALTFRVIRSNIDAIPSQEAA